MGGEIKGRSKKTMCQCRVCTKVCVFIVLGKRLSRVCFKTFTIIIIAWERYHELDCECVVYFKH